MTETWPSLLTTLAITFGSVGTAWALLRYLDR